MRIRLAEGVAGGFSLTATASPTSVGFPGSGTPSGYPGVHNTGYTGTLTNSSAIVATTGQIIEDLRIYGKVTIAVPNVIVRNCHIISSEAFGIDADGSTNLLVEDTQVDNTNGNACILDGGGGAMYQRLRLTAAYDGIKLSRDSTLQESLIHDLSPYDPILDTHNDGVQFSVANNITVFHNTILMGENATSAILMGGGEARVRAIDCTIEDNYLYGGGHTIHGPAGGLNVSGGPSINIQIIDNVISGWGYGPLTSWETGVGNVYSGNVDAGGNPI